MPVERLGTLGDSGTVDRFSRIGNDLAVDFANTVRTAERPDDGVLHDAYDVLDFLVVSRTLAGSDAAHIRASLNASGSGNAFFKRALGLRAAVTAALIAIERGRKVDDAALATINAMLEADAGYARLEHRRGTRYSLTAQHITDDPVRLLAPIARAAAELLIATGPPIRKCAAGDCVRFFYDDSRTRRRRWCDMSVCGNRAKAAAFAQRRRETT